MSHTQEYIAAVQAKFEKGNATEHTYRAPMENYLHALLENVEATNEQKRQACGMPDFVLTRTRQKQPIDVGYIEAKDIGVSLDKAEKSDQMKRYLKSLDNLILTDYLEFRFFKEQKKVATIRIAEVDDFFRIEGAQVKALPENFEALETHLKDFVEYTGQTIKSSKMLAGMMARKAQLMRDVFEEALKDEQSSLRDQWKAFQNILIHDMDAHQFADVYAQTIAFGLFTARLHDQTLEDFSRAEARDLIPRSNPFLRQLFDYVCGAGLDHRVVWIVDALCEVYRATNVHEILHNFGKQSGRNDPVVHFYEDFLAEYDAKLRKTRGVWYTPEPVVNFIVRGVDYVLQEHFNLPDGIADNSKITIEVEDQAFDKRTKSGKAKKTQQVHKVQLLDVAAGTGTFTAEAIKQIYQKVCDMGMRGSWNEYVEQHLLPRLHGFEILMASYAMCHLKIDMLLTELGYTPSDQNIPPRLGVYLTNALEEHHPETDTLFASWLAKEASEANRIKRDMPIMVAYGNPPYSVSSQNKGEWITNLIADYKKDLNERNINPLSDDYIKFFRYAQYYIEKTGKGVVAMITNNSFLDGIIHRQMRKNLLETFDHIYILDLHGSAKKKETAPDGSPDTNVFDIQQGVSIAIMVKDGSRKGKLANVWHQDSYGSRKEKYARLWEDGVNQKLFEKLDYKEPYYFFSPKDFSNRNVYEQGFSLNIAFPMNSSGMSFRKDPLLVKNNFCISDVNEMLKDMQCMSEDSLKTKYLLRETKDWKISEQRVNFTSFDDKDIQATLYRPFDIRYTFYPLNKISKIIPRGDSRKELMQHLMADNFGLIVPRQASEDAGGLITNIIACHKTFSAYNRNYILPLYLYPDTTCDQAMLEDAAQGESVGKRRPNLDEAIVGQIAKALKLPFVSDHEDKAAEDQSCFSPLDLLDYIYATLHSPTYRETYKEFLKIDFPRIPYPTDAQQFWQLAALGGELRQFHLMEHPALNKATTQFTGEGDNIVDKIGKTSFRDVKDGIGNVYINEGQYFEGVPELAWNFHIGGYQPAQKWLKDRKERKLSFDDIRHYQKIITALTETDRLMQTIDEI